MRYLAGRRSTQTNIQADPEEKFPMIHNHQITKLQNKKKNIKAARERQSNI